MSAGRRRHLRGRKASSLKEGLAVRGPDAFLARDQAPNVTEHVRGNLDIFARSRPPEPVLPRNYAAPGENLHSLRSLGYTCGHTFRHPRPPAACDECNARGVNFNL